MPFTEGKRSLRFPSDRQGDACATRVALLHPRPQVRLATNRPVHADDVFLAAGDELIKLLRDRLGLQGTCLRIHR